MIFIWFSIGKHLSRALLTASQIYFIAIALTESDTNIEHNINICTISCHLTVSKMESTVPGNPPPISNKLKLYPANFCYEQY